MKISLSRKLSIDQHLAAFGQTSDDNNLHLYIHKETMQQLPVEFPFRLDHYCIILVTKGICQIQLDLITHTHHKNDLIIATPQMVIQFISMSPDYQFKLVSFSATFPVTLGIKKEYIDTFTFFANQRTPVLSLKAEEITVISTLIDLLQQKYAVKSHPFRSEIVFHSFSLIMFEISALHRQYYSMSSYQLTRKEELSLRFLRLLSQNVRSERSVQFYSDRLGVSPDYLTRITRESLNKTAGTVIADMVVQEAKILLHQSALSIAQVSESMCFNDQFEFSKFFRKRTGLTPSAYRKNG